MRKQSNSAIVSKTPKKYQPSRVEVAKTVLIAVLITGLIAFVLGMQFAEAQNSEVQAARAVQVVTENPAKK